MKKSVAVLLWVLVLAVVAFAAGHISYDPTKSQNEASSVTAEEVSTLQAGDSSNTYLTATELQSAIADTATADAQQKAAATALANIIDENATAVSFATIDTSKIDISNGSVVIPVKVSSLPENPALYAYIGGALYKGTSETMWTKTANNSTFICIKWDDITKDGEKVSSAGVESAADGDMLTPVATSSTGGSLGGSSGGCSTGMSALAFGVLGLFLACRKK